MEQTANFVIVSTVSICLSLWIIYSDFSASWWPNSWSNHFWSTMSWMKQAKRPTTPQTDGLFSVSFVNQPPKIPVNTLLDCRTFTDVVKSNYSPKEHQQQGDSTQILPICECWNLEGCDNTNSQGHRDQIDDLWKKNGIWCSHMKTI